MSIEAIAAVWAINFTHSSDKLVALAIANHTDKKSGRAWPGISRISEMTQLTTRAVNRSIARLHEQGYLQVVHRSGHSNVFTLQTPATGSPTPATGSPPPPPQGQGTPATGSPISVIDPSFETSRIRSRGRYDDTGERADLERWAKNIGYRPITEGQSLDSYRTEIKQYQGRWGVAELGAEIDKRRTRQ